MCRFLISLLFSASLMAASNDIRLNQVGYYPSSVKRFVVIETGSTEFAIKDRQGAVLFKGQLVDNGRWDACASAISAGAPEVPVIDAELGPCSVTFTVTDSEKKPIYNAKIDVLIRYGFLGLHKSELQIGTNSDGKARVTGLLEKVKKPLEFHITNGPVTKTVMHDPAVKCDSTVNVTLGTK